MSGPKVVRIVTREEIIETCQGLLARVDAALAEWIAVGKRNECVDEDAVEAATARGNALASLIASDRFMDLQKQAPVEEAFLRDDLQHRLAQVASRQAAARSRGRREREAATALLRNLRERGAEFDPDLAKRLEQGDAAALAEGFQILSKSADTYSASAELAGRLREGEEGRGYASWLAAQPAASDPAIDRIELRIAQLEQISAEEAVRAWRARLDEAAIADNARRGLLLDGLEVETGRALTEARRRADAAADLRLLLAELDAAGLATAALREGTDRLDAMTIEKRIAQARAELDAHRECSPAAARRAAVLEGLTALGYEVTEGMQTSLAQEGRLVLRSAARPDYGVEINAAGARMQMRPVAFDAGGQGPDVSRDRDAETIWCGDVAALQQGLANNGDALVIEKSLPVGATPLRRIEVASGRHAGEIASPKTRTLR
ncbi:MAG TPA: hypothetical protein VMG08_08810 [Allosphingosinicella sp.]|nr:hypothetical protein [Allosphingosinicella sp.]